jgi:hypothetical protein
MPNLLTTVFAQNQIDFIAAEFVDPCVDVFRVEDCASYQRAQVRAAVQMSGSISWSPDGQLLAFVASIDGPSSDVYVRQMETGEVRRVSSGPTQAGHLLWSPDGSYVVHSAIGDINVGRSGSDIISGLWASPLSGDRPRLLVDGSAFPLGWLSPRYLLAYMNEWWCGPYDLLLGDVVTGGYALIWPGPLIGGGWEDGLPTYLAGPPPDPGSEVDAEFREACPAPRNPPLAIDLALVPGLHYDAFVAAREVGVYFTVLDGEVLVRPAD